MRWGRPAQAAGSSCEEPRQRFLPSRATFITSVLAVTNAQVILAISDTEKCYCAPAGEDVGRVNYAPYLREEEEEHPHHPCHGRWGRHALSPGLSASGFLQRWKFTSDERESDPVSRGKANRERSEGKTAQKKCIEGSSFLTPPCHPLVTTALTSLLQSQRKPV